MRVGRAAARDGFSRGLCAYDSYMHIDEYEDYAEHRRHPAESGGRAQRCHREDIARAHGPGGVDCPVKCAPAGEARGYGPGFEADFTPAAGRCVILIDTSVWVDHLRNRNP